MLSLIIGARLHRFGTECCFECFCDAESCITVARQRLAPYCINYHFLTNRRKRISNMVAKEKHMKIETIGSGIPEAVGATARFLGETVVAVAAKAVLTGATIAYVAALVLERLPLPYGEVDNNPTRYR
jgi:hypothetical protein